MGRPVEPRYAPSGTAADAWVLYLLTARHALSGDEPAGAWSAWLGSYRRHAHRASRVWWFQILVITGGWALGAVVCLVTWTLLGTMGVSDQGGLSLFPGGVVGIVAAMAAAWPVLSPRRLARALGLEVTGPPRVAEVSPPGDLGYLGTPRCESVSSPISTPRVSAEEK